MMVIFDLNTLSSTNPLRYYDPLIIDSLLTLPSLKKKCVGFWYGKGCWDTISFRVTQRRADLMSGDSVHF